MRTGSLRKDSSPTAFTALKVVGAAYLMWIGVRTILAARRDARAIEEGLAPTPPMGPRRAFREGVVVEALNPKTAAFFLAFLPQFVDVSAGHVALQFVILGLTWMSEHGAGGWLAEWAGWRLLYFRPAEYAAQPAVVAERSSHNQLLHVG